MAPDTLSLEGKVAIITGSGRENGIGAAIARVLARNGASVVINHVSDASKARAMDVAAEIVKAGGKAAVVQGTIETIAGARDIVDKTLAAFGAQDIDILVNNAGGPTAVARLLEVPSHAMEKDFSLNLYGVVYMIQAAVPHMPRGGRIINIGSVVSRMQIGGGATYAAAKAALDHITGSWAAELGRTHGITINTLAPGPTQTDVNGADSPIIDGILKQIKAEARQSTTEDVADAVLLFASEKSRWITGQWVEVSGGVVTA